MHTFTRALSNVRKALRIGILCFSFAVLVSFSVSARAEWRKPDTANARILTNEKEYHVAKDGSFELSDTTVTEILRDDARDSVGTSERVWNPETTKLLSVKGWTTNKAKSLPLDAKYIDTKFVSWSSSGFDQDKRTLVSYPEVLLGSKIKESWTLHTFKVPVPGFFAQRFVFGDRLPEAAGSRIVIRSAMPLYFQSHDPEHYLAIRQWQEKQTYILEATLTKDAYFRLSDDEDSPWWETPPEPRLEVASSRDWILVQKTFSEGFESQLASPLPAFFAEPISQITQQHKDFVHRSDAWTSWLADHVRYMGDWRTLKGSYQPRPFPEVAKTGFGDCKDYATLTAAALRKMGYKAHVALVKRGSYRIDRSLYLPSLGAFNHAIVYAEDEQGKGYWIDPTNTNSYAAGKRLDIAGKKSLILDPSRGAELEELPAIEANDGYIRWTHEFLPLSQSSRKISVQMEFTGINGSSPSEFFQREGLENVKNFTKNMISDGFEVMNYTLEPIVFQPRRVQDIRIKAEMEAKWLPNVTTAGIAFELKAMEEDLQKIKLKNRVSGYRFDRSVPVHSMRTWRLKNAQLVGDEVRDCKIESQWMKMERSIMREGSDIVIYLDYTNLKAGMSLTELKSKEAYELRQNLRRCFAAMQVIYKPAQQLSSEQLFEEAPSLAH